MENPKNQLASKLKEANNVLVTVSANPSVDQLAAAIGLTLFLTKLKKHAATVFSGQVPSTIDFLKPDETIEHNTDSLRDFIISLDKAKADKIRYKVEDTMVKIFITPYRTSIGEHDLVFSQGDFNVDVVIGLGIHNREDLDQVITAHGRILHDATVATLNTKDGSDIGTLNWVDSQASSLCEMAVALTDLLKANSLDGQMATALLTGIVAETERFSNEKTSSTTMSASAKLMAAGANQQLVATKLEPPEDQPIASGSPQGPQDGGGGSQGGNPPDAAVDDDGALRIDHESTIPGSDEPPPAPPPLATLPEPVPPPPEPEEPQAPPVSQVKIDDQGQLQAEEPHIQQDHRQFLGKPPVAAQDEGMFGVAPNDEDKDDKSSIDLTATGAKIVTEPPQFGGQLSAAADDSSDETSPLNLPPVSTPLLNHDSGTAQQNKAQEPVAPPAPPAPAPPPQPVPVPPPTEYKPAETPQVSQPFVEMGNKTLKDIEHKVESPHLEKPTKLPEPFVRSLDNSTLAGLEERIDSPHLKAKPSAEPPEEQEHDYHKDAVAEAAKAMSGAKLNEIEQKVDSPHLDSKPAEEAAKKDNGPQLSYEPHESEPPDSSGGPGDASFTPDDTTASDNDAATTDDNATADKPEETADEEKDDKQDEARDAVMQAINAHGDGRSSLPALDGIGTSGLVDVGHAEEPVAATPYVVPPPAPPPLPIEPQSQVPSQNIHIDDKGNLTSAPPTVPPPMMPPASPVEENNHDLPQAA